MMGLLQIIRKIQKFNSIFTFKISCMHIPFLSSSFHSTICLKINVCLHSFQSVDPATLRQTHVLSPCLPVSERQQDSCVYPCIFFYFQIAFVSRSSLSIFGCHTFSERTASVLVLHIKYSWRQREEKQVFHVLFHHLTIWLQSISALNLLDSQAFYFSSLSLSERNIA